MSFYVHKRLKEYNTHLHREDVRPGVVVGQPVGRPTRLVAPLYTIYPIGDASHMKKLEKMVAFATDSNANQKPIFDRFTCFKKEKKKLRMLVFLLH